jgi:hypothetical protein
MDGNFIWRRRALKFGASALCAGLVPASAECAGGHRRGRCRARVYAVADWLPNVQSVQSEAFYRALRTRFPKPEDDYIHMRMQKTIPAERAEMPSTCKMQRP